VTLAFVFLGCVFGCSGSDRQSPKDLLTKHCGIDVLNPTHLSLSQHNGTSPQFAAIPVSIGEKGTSYVQNDHHRVQSGHAIESGCAVVACHTGHAIESGLEALDVESLNLNLEHGDLTCDHPLDGDFDHPPDGDVDHPHDGDVDHPHDGDVDHLDDGHLDDGHHDDGHLDPEAGQQCLSLCEAYRPPGQAGPGYPCHGTSRQPIEGT
jgi:hypothetical protein